MNHKHNFLHHITSIVLPYKQQLKDMLLGASGPMLSVALRALVHGATAVAAFAERALKSLESAGH
jgi:hypothetical protein